MRELIFLPLVLCFTFIAIKDTGEVSNLLTYECFYNDFADDNYNLDLRRCGFDRDPENIPILEGDVIDIRTERTHIFMEEM